MPRKKIFAIVSVAISLLFLTIFVLSNHPLSAIAVIAFMFVCISYLRAKNYFYTKIPGKFYSIANYTIGFTIAGAILLVDIFLMNHTEMQSSIYYSIYAAEIATGAIFAVAMFISDHSKRSPGEPEQKSGDIIFATFSSCFLIALIIFTFVVETGFAA
ncbi:hypothetical protein J6X15_04555 [Candidatus Saccharibacteria bacterium]|nr:hypothetical protein [Candidatus Saccharibacteria bacterium]